MWNPTYSLLTPPPDLGDYAPLEKGRQYSPMPGGPVQFQPGGASPVVLVALGLLVGVVVVGGIAWVAR